MDTLRINGQKQTPWCFDNFNYISAHLIEILLLFFQSSKASTVCLRVAKTQRIHNLIKLRAWVSLEAHGSTAINLYTSADCWDSRKPQPPHATCIMNRCARSWSHWSSDAWRMAEFHQRPRVKSYPLPDPGIGHRCMMSVPMCWDWKVTANPLTHLRLPYGAAIPATTHHEPWTFSSQIPTSNYSVPEELRAFFYSPSPAIPLDQPALRHPPKPFTCGRKHIVQEEVQTMSQLVGHGFSMIWPCNCWCRAVSFYYLLNTTQNRHFLNALLKKGTLIPPPKIFSEMWTFALFINNRTKPETTQMLCYSFKDECILSSRLSICADWGHINKMADLPFHYNVIFFLLFL